MERLNIPSYEMVIAESLRGQWRDMVSSLGGDVSLVNVWVKVLAEQYQYGDRAYHNLTHIGRVSDFLNKYKDISRNFTALKFAGDGHDVIYNAGSSLNEEKSAIFTGHLMRDMKIPEEIINETERIIRLTKTHKTSEDDVDGKLMIDADFSVFALPEAEYDEYAHQIWEEYVGSGKIPEKDFKTGRAGLIRGWLDESGTDRIFLTDEIEEEFGDQARKNLSRELKILES